MKFSEDLQKAEKLNSEQEKIRFWNERLEKTQTNLAEFKQRLPFLKQFSHQLKTITSITAKLKGETPEARKAEYQIYIEAVKTELEVLKNIINADTTPHIGTDKTKEVDTIIEIIAKSIGENNKSDYKAIEVKEYLIIYYDKGNSINRNERIELACKNLNNQKLYKAEERLSAAYEAVRKWERRLDKIC